MHYPTVDASDAPQCLPASEEETKQISPAASTPPEERLSPRAEMRLALTQGKDILAEQEGPWVI